MTSPRTLATRDRQQAVLYAISVHWKQHGYAPTLREIQALTGFSSISVVSWHLRGLRPTLNMRYETGLLPERERARIHHLPPSADRAAIRSKTYPGVARAMARQWGRLLQGELIAS